MFSDPPTKLFDNRDLEVMVSYEPPGQARFEELIRIGPKPGVRRPAFLAYELIRPTRLLMASRIDGLELSQ